VVIGTPVARSRVPKAASNITPSAVAAAATTPGTSPASAAWRSGAAILLVSTMISSGFLILRGVRQRESDRAKTPFGSA
jgi:hypothetical protein